MAETPTLVQRLRKTANMLRADSIYEPTRAKEADEAAAELDRLTLALQASEAKAERWKAEAMAVRYHADAMHSGRCSDNDSDEQCERCAAWETVQEMMRVNDSAETPPTTPSCSKPLTKE